ncbi:MAG: hypothetical protein RUMPE_00900 [Eubacteriales bacterium SKADARSKE-1]|nr:hypothetical protein [Eubacteriales bacterium SKADARSKE-1]
MTSIKYNDHEAKPVLEKTGLVSDDVYSQGDLLYLSDDKCIYSPITGKRFLKASENYFFGSHYLLQYKIGPNAELTMTITDTQTNEEVFSVKNILSFKLAEHQVIAYCTGKMEAFDY